MRKMATIRTVGRIKPIEGADSIECAEIDGWDVVIKKGDFESGDVVIFVEVDAWVPHDIAPFLSKNKEPKEYEGIKGERLRTVKLRGKLSQGLIFPMADFFKRDSKDCNWYHGDPAYYLSIGDDVSDILKIKKYDPPVPAQLAGEVKGMFPTEIPRTDQERIQNLLNELVSWTQEETIFEITEKLDGSSTTCYYKNNEFGVCSRNLDLKRSSNNSFWKTALNQGLEDILAGYGEDIAIQGELIGEGIQGNPYKIKGQQFYLFDVFLISQHRYMTPKERKLFAEYNSILHVPIIDYYTVRPVDELLLSAEGKSALNPNTEREGLVYKNINGQESFKVISNKFLLKNGG